MEYLGGGFECSLAEIKKQAAIELCNALRELGGEYERLDMSGSNKGDEIRWHRSVLVMVHQLTGPLSVEPLVSGG